MLTGIAIRNTGYILKIRLKGIARVTFCFPYNKAKIHSTDEDIIDKLDIIDRKMTADVRVRKSVCFRTLIVKIMQPNNGDLF